MDGVFKYTELVTWKFTIVFLHIMEDYIYIIKVAKKYKMLKLLGLHGD